MLIEISRRRCSPVGEQITSLSGEHRSLDASWAQLRAVLADIAQGQARLLEPAWVDDFVGTYLGHIAREESQIFPFAEAYLDRQQLAMLSAAMVARRTTAPQ